MACLSFCYKGLDRLLAVFPEWFGIDKVQASVIVFGSFLVALGIVFDIVSPSPSDPGSRFVNQFYFNFGTNHVSLGRFTTTSISALFFAIMFAGRMPRQLVQG